MAITEMSLPIDIPWKRMGVSKDMIDPSGGNLSFPQKWRSSIAVFYHEPAELPPDYCNRKITYLKIVCTITNYQVDGDDVTVLDELKKKKYGDFYAPAWETFDAKVTQSFPCYGALMQVGVYPHHSATGLPIPFHDFPYIAGFQPRKREMYEVVTESGEVGSQSGSKLNVLKGTTSSDTLETYDMELGGGSSGTSGVWGAWSEQSSDPNVQKGTIQSKETQNQNVTSKDAAREKRESHAYSTNINQLYTLLQGYHLGTNRAIFFLQPRPHMQDQKFTFIRGLRRLEGIQEFFLIIDRPASVPGICVEVALETAHAYLYRSLWPHFIPDSELYAPGNLNKTAAALGIDLQKSYPWHYDLLVHWWNADPLWRFIASIHPQSPPPEMQPGQYPSDFGHLVTIAREVPNIGIENISLIFEEYESDSGWFFVTGRRLCACVKPMISHDETANIDCETSAEEHISTCDSRKSPVGTTSPQDAERVSSAGGAIVYSKEYQGRSRMSRKSIEGTKKGVDLNAMVHDINQALWSSVGSSERFPYGTVSFLETDFVLDELSQLMRLLKNAGIRDRALSDVEGILPFIQRGLGEESKVRNVLDLATLSTTAVARDLNITKAEARQVRRDLLLKGLTSLDAASIRRGFVPENPILERFRTEFPEARLRELEQSARPVTRRTSQPVKRTAGSAGRKKRSRT